jgi:hypothetical protein
VILIPNLKKLYHKLTGFTIPKMAKKAQLMRKTMASGNAMVSLKTLIKGKSKNLKPEVCPGNKIRRIATPLTLYTTKGYTTYDVP